jgi:hypothetical protein
MSEAHGDAGRAARCLLALFHGAESDEAYVGEILLAEGLHALRDIRDGRGRM